MKKIYPLILLIFMFPVINVSAQCTPHEELTYNGIYPEKLPDAMLGVDYYSTLSFKIPQDSVITGGIAVSIDSAKFLYASGQPSGFTFQCNTPRCSWPGGAKGCALFTGKADINNAAAVREYPMKIYTQTWYKIKGAPQQYSRIDSASNFKFTIVAYNGLGEISKYTPLTAYPNPATGVVTIEVRNVMQDAGEVTVTDMTGRVVYHKTFAKPSEFLTTFTADLGGHKPGLYLVSFKAGDQYGLSRIMLR
jgi:hypothetical protein